MHSSSFLVLDRILIYGLLACVPTLLAFASPLWWPLELFSHFRFHYLSIGCLLLPLAIYRRHRGAIALAGLLVVGNAPYIVQHQMRRLPEAKAAKVYRALLFNMNADNQEFAAIRHLLDEVKPDFLLLIELRPSALKSLDLPALGFEYSLQKAQADNFGIGLFSRYPLLDGRVEVFGSTGLPSVVATVDFRDCQVQVIGSHPPPPIHANFAKKRMDQLAGLAQFAAQSRDQPLLLMMDMNTSPWSYVFSEFETSSGLYDSRRGQGLQASWPASIPFLRIPIDHIFHSDKIAIVNRQMADFSGSDHRPIILDFSCL